ncbi:MAG: N-formylglutamate amidohydrolase [Rhodobacteraceae bacterium]|nr:N-formylglutamate amidohydrolase [Paracoccaceae bacterium]
MTTHPRPPALLTARDPAPVEWVNRDSDAPVLLVCEHAGQAIPEMLGDLGLPPGAIDDHIGWDIGAMGVARLIAGQLGAPLIAQRYSRLVIDCNRPPQSAGAIPAVSDTQAIPANVALSPEQRAARVRNIFDPFATAVESGFQSHPRRLALSIHSFTPALRLGPPRPWHAGFLARQELDTSQRLLDHVAGAADLTLALNQPYQIDDETDWFVPTQCETRNIRHCLVEIRNDQIRTPEGQSLWAGYLAGAIRSVLEAG